MFPEEDKNDPQWEREGLIMKQLQSAKSPHIVRMFGNMNRDKSVGNKDEQVIRLFLEYCPGRSLDSLLEQDYYRSMMRKPAPEVPIMEADLWAIFHCLALGAIAIDRGTEDPQAKAWNRKGHIVHYE